MFFQLLSTIKVNLVAEIMQRAYLCVTFHLKHKKLPFFTVLTWFLILSKIQDLGQDGDHCWRHSPLAAPRTHKIYLTLLRRSKAFHWKQNRFKILQHIKNFGEGFHPTPPPPPSLYHGGGSGGMNLRVRLRVNKKLECFNFEWTIRLTLSVNFDRQFEDGLSVSEILWTAAPRKKKSEKACLW